MGKFLHGVIPPIVTPIDEKERVDEKALRMLVNHCIDNGIHAIFVCGSNGECMGLTQAERDRAIRIVLDETGDRVPVLAGCMDSSTVRVIENIKRFEAMGGRNAVVTSVFYARHATQDESVRHFEQISRNTEANLIVYNIPPFTGLNLTADTMIRISKIDKVIGLKDSSGNYAQFEKLLNYFAGSDFHVLQGATALAAPSMLLGADGYVPALAPLFPKAYVGLYDAAAAGDIERTKTYDRIVEKTQALFPLAKSQTTSTKYAMSKLGFLSPRVCAPTEPITEAEAKALDAYIAQYEEYM